MKRGGGGQFWFACTCMVQPIETKDGKDLFALPIYSAPSAGWLKGALLQGVLESRALVSHSLVPAGLCTACSSNPKCRCCFWELPQVLGTAGPVAVWREMLTFFIIPWQFQIGELANTLTSKLEFLGISRQSISNFHVLLLQTEVIECSFPSKVNAVCKGIRHPSIT